MLMSEPTRHLQGYAVSGLQSGRLHYEMPTGEIIYDFFALRLVPRGYASLDYEFIDYRKEQVSLRSGYAAQRRSGGRAVFIAHRDKATAVPAVSAKS